MICMMVCVYVQFISIIFSGIKVEFYFDMLLDWRPEDMCLMDFIQVLGIFIYGCLIMYCQLGFPTIYVYIYQFDMHVKGLVDCLNQKGFACI